MISCPNCHQAVEIEDKHLGTIFTCPQCSSVYFIDWNGQPEVADHSQAPQAESEGESFLSGEQYASGFEPGETFSPFTPVDPSSETSPEESPASGTLDQWGSEGLNSVDDGQDEAGPYLKDPELGYTDSEENPMAGFSEIEPYDSGAEYKSAEAEETPYDFNQTLDAVAEPQASSSSLDDISEFANAEARSGGLTYDIIITGLDSVPVLKAFKEAITDARFAWSEDEIMSQIVRGHLHLKNITPVKAAVLINRIKYLEINLTWRQSVYS